jgi:hypothetical protein
MTTTRNGTTSPLTFGQLSLWRSDQAIPAERRPEWHFSRVWAVPDGTSTATVLAAVNALSRRHESLRTTVDATGPKPRQVVRQHTEAPIGVETAECTHEEALETAVRLAAQPFDLAQVPGWRALILQDAGGRPRYACVAFHHIAVDQWALGILESEYETLVAAGDPEEAASVMPAVLQPRQLADVQRSAAWASRATGATRYWRRVLAKYPRAGEPGAMSFSTGGGRIRVAVSSQSLGPAFARVADAAQVTSESAVLAVVLEAIAEFAVPMDEPLMLMAANRFEPGSRTMVSTQNQAAMLSIPDRGGDFAEFATKVEWAGRTAFRHGCYDFDEFTDVVNEVRGAPLRYDYFFNHASSAAGADDQWAGQVAPEITSSDAPQSTGPRLDIRVYRDPSLTLDMRADPRLVSREVLVRLAEWIYTRVHDLAAADARTDGNPAQAGSSPAG